MGFMGPLLAAEKQPHSKAEIVKLLTDGRDYTVALARRALRGRLTGSTSR